MKLAGWMALALVMVTGGDERGATEDGATSPREATREEIDLFFTHLRAHFDDIHDVSMRFHAEDPSIDGTITLAMTWRDGRLEDGEVAGNDTGCEDEGPALLEAVGAWHIEGLDGPARLRIPLRIKLVGSEEPAFPHRAIVTGSVRSAGGRWLHRARVEFVPRDEGVEPVPDALTSREGIFVRTLIPPGSWDLVCTADGHGEEKIAGVRLSAGEHRRADFVMAPSEAPSQVPAPR